MKYNLSLIGFGNVARSFVRLLERKRGLLQSQYGISWSITGIATGRHGFAVNPDGLGANKALELVESKQSIFPLSSFPVNNSLEVIQRSQADVMFENSPVDHHNGQPAMDHVRAALEAGQHVITANKGTVVHGYRELTALARSKGRKFLFESTVWVVHPLFGLPRDVPAGGIALVQRHPQRHDQPHPVAHGERRDLRGSRETLPVHRDCGDRSLRRRGRLGRGDQGRGAGHGADGRPHLKPQDVERKGIREITPGMVEQAKAGGKRYKLVCSAEKVREAVKARVAPELVDSSSPLYGIMNSSSGVTFRTDVLPDYSITVTEREGMQGGPVETAYGLLADFVSLASNKCIIFR
ncbi:MAG: hypothetical protein MZV64_00430 [Ignavibacteriales bacterium]|nr:hypothetical protein [Ignavibacteriales bacterium]